jgi:hypothetical protein
MDLTIPTNIFVDPQGIATPILTEGERIAVCRNSFNPPVGREDIFHIYLGEIGIYTDENTGVDLEVASLKISINPLRIDRFYEDARTLAHAFLTQINTACQQNELIGYPVEAADMKTILKTFKRKSFHVLLILFKIQV